MALVLNNLQRVDMPLNKETKPINFTSLFTTIPSFYGFFDEYRFFYYRVATIPCKYVLSYKRFVRLMSEIFLLNSILFYSNFSNNYLISPFVSFLYLGPSDYTVLEYSW